MSGAAAVGVRERRTQCCHGSVVGPTVKADAFGNPRAGKHTGLPTIELWYSAGSRTKAMTTKELPLLGRGPAPVGKGVPVLAIGFRPFFLLAALSACLLVPSWLAVLLLGVRWAGALPALLWHPHEMLFGYTSAVIAGFLLTATQNWTGQVVARGGTLVMLVALWFAGRLVCAFGVALPSLLAAALDLAFLPVLALCVARPIVRTRNLRNAPMPVILLVLAGANGLFWFGALQRDAPFILRGQRIALDVIALLILVIGGRIIPGFTANAVPGTSVRARNLLDVAGVSSMALLLAVDATVPQSGAAAYCAGLAAVTNVARLWRWGGSRALSLPILAVLHVGFACTAIALALRALALQTGALLESTATHLLTVGGIGLMTFGMMARVALGHTGRPLVLPRSIVFGIVAIGVSALGRVLGPLWFASQYPTVLLVSGTLWTLAFALYLIHYTPILLGPRADGRPG